MSIVITGTTGFRNRGVEAFVRPTVGSLRDRLPDLPIAILTPTPEYDSQRLHYPGVQLVKNDFDVGPGGRNVRRLRRSAAVVLRRQPRSEYNQANWLLRSASVVVAMGGDVFSSDYGNLGKHLLPLDYAQQHGVAVVFLAHSVGPFDTEEETESWMRIARGSELITVRESLTYHYVVDQLGIPARLVYLTADPAFLLAPPPPDTVQGMLQFYGIEQGRPLIALAVSQGISRFGGVGRKEHFEAWLQIVRFLIRETGAQLLLIPHVQAGYMGNDDRIIATELIRSLDYAPDLHLAGGDHTASEFKSLIGASDMVIAERMHGAIAGLSSGVCTVAVGYSVKAQGIMADLLGSDWVDDGFVIPAHRLTEGHTVCQLVGSAWERRGEARRRLAASLPGIKDRAAENVALLSAWLE